MDKFNLKTKNSVVTITEDNTSITETESQSLISARLDDDSN